MKTAKDVAIDVVREICGGIFSRETIITMMSDEGETGRTMKKMADVIERTIEADRKTQAALHAPS